MNADVVTAAPLTRITKTSGDERPAQHGSDEERTKLQTV